jgi:putative radical SAM enzyme (TIGR03279 family)
MQKITSIKPNSLAERSGVREGDKLVSINGQAINDLLDLYFYEADEKLEIVMERNRQRRQLTICKEFEDQLGIELEDFKMQRCSNNCIFCFIKQNPPNMRRQIYYCDEDYRYSFLYGNYITLTNIRKVELDRIVTQRLSPLYISVHATNPEVRRSIFRFKGDDHLLDKIAFLTKHRIELHTQIVLVPGINDGKTLDRTIQDLYRFRSAVKSLAIVPVGLTKHRRHLPSLQEVTPEMALKLIDCSEFWNRHYLNNDGEPFVYLSDEFYLLAERPFPPIEQYGSFYQIENGVGLCRQLIDAIRKCQRDFPHSINTKRKIALVTGTLATPVLREYVLPYLHKIAKLSVGLITVNNDFFGESVTVSGLLTAADIIDQFPEKSDYDCIYLPPNCINNNGVLLDDQSPLDIEHSLGIPVKIGSDDFLKMVKDCGE